MRWVLFSRSRKEMVSFVKLRKLRISSNSIHFSLELEMGNSPYWSIKSCQGQAVQTGVKVPLHNYFIKLTSSTFRRHWAFSQDGNEFLYTGIKTVLDISENGNFSAQGRFLLGDWSNTVLCIDLFLEHFSCLHLNSRQHSDPHCALQSVVDSSSNKIFAPLPCYEWFMCWRYCSAAFCCFFVGNRKWQVAYSFLYFQHFELHLVRIFSHNSYRN